jgi:hypothetical protein
MYVVVYGNGWNVMLMRWDMLRWMERSIVCDGMFVDWKKMFFVSLILPSIFIEPTIESYTQLNCCAFVRWLLIILEKGEVWCGWKLKKNVSTYFIGNWLKVSSRILAFTLHISIHHRKVLFIINHVYGVLSSRCNNSHFRNINKWNCNVDESERITNGSHQTPIENYIKYIE